MVLIYQVRLHGWRVGQASLPAGLGGFQPPGVAQICNLLYRRIAFCGALASPSALELSNALPITNRRYGRLQICATRPRCALNTYESLPDRLGCAWHVLAAKPCNFGCGWVF
jgi:hypothetical protein